VSGGSPDSVIPRGVAAIPDGPVHVHFDGACEEVGGRRVAAYGYTLEGAGLAHEEFGLAVPPGHPRATNNVAEYVGAICALEWLVGQRYTGGVSLAGDSQLVIRQMTGEYRVLSEGLRPYHERLVQLARAFRHVEFLWVPREENSRADELSKLGIGLGRGNATPDRTEGSRARPPSDDDGLSGAQVRSSER
jgi:ribonuclease HI